MNKPPLVSFSRIQTLVLFFIFLLLATALQVVEFAEINMEEQPYERQYRLQRQKSGCKNPFVPFKHGVKDDMTNFEPLQTLQEKDNE